MMSLILRHSKLPRTTISISSCSIRNSSICLSFRSWDRGLATTPSRLSANPPLVEKSNNKPGTRDPRSSLKSSGLKGLRNRNKKQVVDDASADIPPRMILGQSEDLPIRARFAPSPTGLLHLGSLRTALFNKLSASASQGGAFVLRIEDTDQSRLVPGAEESLIKDLTWAGLTWDEGPGKGGPYGPYRQSERLPIYQDHVQKLLDKGHAYRCFCSPDLLEAQKRKLHEAGKPTVYPGTCRSIDAEESTHRCRQGESHVVRLKADRFGRLRLKDAIYGAFQKKDREDDFILMKTDGFPTYHFANVVDDHLMNITHVIRGEEWLISTPKHLALYEAFGWQPPTFAHLALLINEDGTKLSKRHASVNIAAYQEEGIFPMALLAWLAHHGSSFKPGFQAPRTIQDLADALTFKFTRGGIKLNSSSLDFFNTRYRDALLWKPLFRLAKQESQLIDQHFTQPMLREIKSITASGLTPHLGPAAQSWNRPLEPVPALADDANANAATKKSWYIVKALRIKQGGFQDTESLILQHPYLFWRVPTDVYRLSLSSFKLDTRILNALEKAISQEAHWKTTTSSSSSSSSSSPSGDGHGIMVWDSMRSLLEPQGVGLVSIHDTLRLIAAGRYDVPSPSSSKMFAILGREEWAHRLAVVRGVIRG